MHGGFPGGPVGGRVRGISACLLQKFAEGWPNPIVRQPRGRPGLRLLFDFLCLRGAVEIGQKAGVIGRAHSLSTFRDKSDQRDVAGAQGAVIGLDFRKVGAEFARVFDLLPPFCNKLFHLGIEAVEKVQSAGTGLEKHFFVGLGMQGKRDFMQAQLGHRGMEDIAERRRRGGFFPCKRIGWRQFLQVLIGHGARAIGPLAGPSLNKAEAMVCLGHLIAGDENRRIYRGVEGVALTEPVERISLEHFAHA